jgi:hypothetical protein
MAAGLASMGSGIAFTAGCGIYADPTCAAKWFEAVYIRLRQKNPFQPSETCLRPRALLLTLAPRRPAPTPTPLFEKFRKSPGPIFFRFR